MADQIQLRRTTAASWTATNPMLAQGEFGYETDTNKLKLGDGSTAWNSLSYYENPAVGSASISDVIVYAIALGG
jgi:hypothetical protein